MSSSLTNNFAQSTSTIQSTSTKWTYSILLTSSVTDLDNGVISLNIQNSVLSPSNPAGTPVFRYSLYTDSMCSTDFADTSDITMDYSTDILSYKTDVGDGYT